MKHQPPLDAVTLQQRLAPGNLFQNLRRKIFPLEEDAQLSLLKRRIVEQRKQDGGIVVVQQCRQLIPGRCKGAFSIVLRASHLSALPAFPAWPLQLCFRRNGEAPAQAAPPPLPENPASRQSGPSETQGVAARRAALRETCTAPSFPPFSRGRTACCAIATAQRGSPQA